MADAPPNGQKPPPLYERKKTPFETGVSADKAIWNAGGRVVLVVLTLMMVGLALYMAMVLRHPLTSVYVIAPAVGAVWFGLRLFMTMTPKG